MDTISIIQAVARGVIGAVVIGGSIYMLSTGVTIPTEWWGLAGIIVGGLFGVEAIAKVFRAKSQ